MILGFSFAFLDDGFRRLSRLWRLLLVVVMMKVIGLLFLF